jgi:hypothetical protein
MAKATLMRLKISCWPQLWHNYDKLRHMHHGTPQHFALPVRGRLSNQFTGRWIGGRGTTDSTVYDLCWAQEESTNKNREHLMKWNNKFEITFVAFPPNVLRKKNRVCVCKVDSACQECWDLCWDFMPNIVLALKWCKHCTNTAFHSAVIAI